jgi:hypothetical protein
VYAYVHRRLLEVEGNLVRLTDFAAGAPRYPALDQRQILGKVLDLLGFLPGQPLAERNRQIREQPDLRISLTEQILRTFGRTDHAFSPGPVVTMAQVRPAHWT